MFFSYLFLDERCDYHVKEVHMTNLRKIVEYCENVVDCRRSMQLNYFAEHFTSEQCLQNYRSACDNCLKKDEFKVSEFLLSKLQILNFLFFFFVLYTCR